MKPKWYIYIGATLIVGLIGVFGALQPKADMLGSWVAPSFVLDPSWPKPLPAPVGSDGVAHTWVTGEVGGNCTDQQDNVYTYNRGWEVGLTVDGVEQGNLSGAIVAEDASASAIPSPPVVVYNSEGKVIAGWGNASLIQTGADYGYAAYMSQSAHGCFVDYQGYVWFAGSGDGIVQKYNPEEAAAAGANATYVMQLGTKGECDGTQTTSNPFSSCGETNDLNSSHTKLNEPADIAVDPLPGPVTHQPGDTYIADGYGNHRVVVFDAKGNYVGQWGTTCMLPPAGNPGGTPVPTNSLSCPPGTFGATGSGHPHCVVLGNDGLVYVCDRPNSRIQVFNKNCAVASSTGNPQPVCQPVRIINISGFNTASADDRAAILLAGTRGCDMDFWPNIDYLADKSPTRQDTILDVDLGNDNTWVINKASGVVVGALGVCGIAPCPGHSAGHFAFGHMVNVDSHGNVYVGETITGRRIQKFVPVDGQHFQGAGT
jgi:NHL repeat